MGVTYIARGRWKRYMSDWSVKAMTIECGLLPNEYRCKKCGSVNVELECYTNGFYVKCEDCGHYVEEDNAKEALKNWSTTNNE